MRDNPIPMTMKEALYDLFTNKNYICLFISFNFLYGLYCAISGIIAQFTSYYKFTTSENSIICLVFLMSGIFNSFLMGTLLDKYQCYRKSLIFLCCSSVFTLALSFFGLPSTQLMTESAIMMVTGATIIPIVTIAFSFAAEITYPVPESYSIGILLSVS